MLRQIHKVGVLASLTSNLFGTDNGALGRRVTLVGKHGHGVVLLGVISTTSAVWKLLDCDRFLANGVLLPLAEAGSLTTAAAMIAHRLLRACAPVAMTILAVKSTAEAALTEALRPQRHKKRDIQRNERVEGREPCASEREL